MAYTVEILPERDDTFSVCLMDDEGEVQEARTELTLAAAVGTASILAQQHQTTYQVVGATRDPQRN